MAWFDWASVASFIAGTLCGGLITYFFDLLKLRGIKKDDAEASYQFIKAQLRTVVMKLSSFLGGTKSVEADLENLKTNTISVNLANEKKRALGDIIVLLQERELFIKNLTHDKAEELTAKNQKIIAALKVF